MLKDSEIRKVYKVFEDNYILVPLEIFEKDPYKTLISTLLSARTKDETTLTSSLKLFKKAPNFKALNSLDESDIARLIYPVGFYKTKAKHLKKLARQMIDEFNSNVPSSRKDLILLPGVGGKTANLVLNRAFNIPAIAVDTHVHKICNLLKWVKTKSPTETETELVRILPKKYWSEMNRLFVSIGRQYYSINKLKLFLEENDLIKHQ